jgi:hypothetical protein
MATLLISVGWWDHENIYWYCYVYWELCKEVWIPIDFYHTTVHAGRIVLGYFKLVLTYLISPIGIDVKFAG